MKIPLMKSVARLVSRKRRATRRSMPPPQGTPTVTPTSLERSGDAVGKIPLMKSVAKLVSHENTPMIVTALLMAGGLGGWAISTTLTTSAVAVEDLPSLEALHAHAIKDVPVTKESPHEELKHSLIGSYRVTGTDSNGRPYASGSIVDVAMAPSGALEIAWDNGKQVGVGQMIGNVLAVASSTSGRTTIWIMTINADGSLSGRWLRRTDRGYRGTETWTRS